MGAAIGAGVMGQCTHTFESIYIAPEGGEAICVECLQARIAELEASENAAIVRIEQMEDQIRELEEWTQYNPGWVQRMKKERDQFLAERDALREEALRGLMEHEWPAFEAAVAARLEAKT